MSDTPNLPEYGAWLTNLPRSEKRRQAMDIQLADMALPYHLHEATDGRAEWDNLVPTIDLDAFRRNVGREVLPGEIGCYQSHLAVLAGFPCQRQGGCTGDGG